MQDAQDLPAIMRPPSRIPSSSSAPPPPRQYTARYWRCRTRRSPRAGDLTPVGRRHITRPAWGMGRHSTHPRAVFLIAVVGGVQGTAVVGALRSSTVEFELRGLAWRREVCGQAQVCRQAGVHAGFVRVQRLQRLRRHLWQASKRGCRHGRRPGRRRAASLRLRQQPPPVATSTPPPRHPLTSSGR